MSRPTKTLAKVLRGTSDANIGFSDLSGLLLHLGFDERMKGSHHIYTREGVVEILNLQPAKGGKAKPYQVKQVRAAIQQYGLALRLNAGDEPDDPGDGDESDVAI